MLSEYLKTDAHLEGEGVELGAAGTHQDYIKLRAESVWGRWDWGAVLLPTFSLSLG